MKMGHFEMVTMLLAAMMLMDIFQVRAEILDMAENTFDDEYLKCSNRLEIKYVPKLFNEEMANLQLLKVWENAKIKWEARKARISLPMNFKDNYGVALMAYISEAHEQTPFYHMFSQAVKMAGQSRKDYIYEFQFKAFHFYLARALQMLRRPCEESYKNVVYSTSQDISFAFGEINQARLGDFTLAYSAKPPATNDQNSVLTIYTCFGVPVEKLFDKQSERIVLIPLTEVFQVSQEGTGNDLVLQSTNKTCSHYECAYLGVAQTSGLQVLENSSKAEINTTKSVYKHLKTVRSVGSGEVFTGETGLKSENCVENPEHIQPVYIYNPDEENQKLEDSGVKSLESTEVPGIKVLQLDENPLQPDENPEDKSQENVDNRTPGPVPAPGPKTHPSASSGRMPLPAAGTFLILISASAVNVFVALSFKTS